MGDRFEGKRAGDRFESLGPIEGRRAGDRFESLLLEWSGRVTGLNLCCLKGWAGDWFESSLLEGLGG